MTSEELDAQIARTFKRLWESERRRAERLAAFWHLIVDGQIRVLDLSFVPIDFHGVPVAVRR